MGLKVGLAWAKMDLKLNLSGQLAALGYKRVIFIDTRGYCD
jgi:hypothetical protein